ncbi:MULTISPECIES: hypothetical protein [Pseudomonas]|uniref:Uncharacterized protein n=1 Tax=Pseudomonas fluorescens TaxID=294 RepID=A0A161Z9Q1_PSEFL|nr:MULTISPECIES: hypothetical protein [Pseudomonas]KZN20447.1 hypothetical protein A1D17_02590 [Pseudomonas fluorescens]
MKRPLSIVLADAFDRAAHDVFVAPQAHSALGDPAPTKWDSWVYWCRGFAAGLFNDGISMPLLKRVVNGIRRKAKPKATVPEPIMPLTRGALENDRLC